MPLYKINKPKIELIDGFEEDEINNYNFTEKYIFWIEGYSLLSDIGFYKFEIGYGNCINDSLFFAYDKIKNNLFINYNIVVNEMKMTDYKLYNETTDTQPSGFSFYPLTNDIIQDFKEDEERYFMSLEDK
jgi:hypothetical protein